MKPSKRPDPQAVRRYWQKSAQQHGLSYAASWSDRYAIEMEIREIAKRLEDGDRVLDAGCGNGFTTVRLASERKIRVRGIDFIPAMVRNARRRLKTSPAGLRARVEFAEGDVTKLREPDTSYDKVISIRVLINLTRSSDRAKALREYTRVLRPGGRLILSEATLEGWKNLNRFRKEWDLSAIPMPSFNRYLAEKELLRQVPPGLRLIERSLFSSTYFAGTRVLKPVLIRAMGLKADAADPTSEWNRWMSTLPAWGDYGTQKLFVFERN